MTIYYGQHLQLYIVDEWFIATLSIIALLSTIWTLMLNDRSWPILLKNSFCSPLLWRFFVARYLGRGVGEGICMRGRPHVPQAGAVAAC